MGLFGLMLVAMALVLVGPFRAWVEVAHADSPLPPVPWWQNCPINPLCSPIEYPPLPTYTPQPAYPPQEPYVPVEPYTPVPEPTCRPTIECPADEQPTPIPTNCRVANSNVLPSPVRSP